MRLRVLAKIRVLLIRSFKDRRNSESAFRDIQCPFEEALHREGGRHGCSGKVVVHAVDEECGTKGFVLMVRGDPHHGRVIQLEDVPTFLDVAHGRDDFTAKCVWSCLVSNKLVNMILIS